MQQIAQGQFGVAVWSPDGRQIVALEWLGDYLEGPRRLVFFEVDLPNQQ
jgi:hypothetical protein